MSKGFVSFVEVKQAVTIVSLLEHYDLLAGLTPKGENLVGVCPFCRGQSARQFQVSREKNAWYCFSCKEGGNILDFVARKERVSLRVAALTLNDWFGLGLDEKGAREPSPAAAATAETRTPAVPALPEATFPTANSALTFILKTLDPSNASLQPLGISAETLIQFGAGYCSKGLLRGRLAIPIRNCAGQILAYAGLALAGEEPRYLLPPKFQSDLEVVNLDRLGESSESLFLAPDLEGVLRLIEAHCQPALGLFNGMLSERQEELLAALLPRFARVALVGNGFAERTVARLARHGALFWSAAVDPRDSGGALPKEAAP